MKRLQVIRQIIEQRPTPPGGALAETIAFEVVLARPAGDVVRCRFWDCGGSEKQGGKEGDPTVGAPRRWPATRKVPPAVLKSQLGS